MHRAPIRAVARPALSTAAPARPAVRRTAATLAGRKVRIGIVGGGPAGFYAASRLLSLPGSEHTRVDLFELLPTPFGLARFGVAPDHPEVKNCEHKFEETARDPRFRFFGNVQVSGATPPSSAPDAHPSALAVPIPLDTLREHYDAVLLTYGAALDRPLGIPGEDTLLNVLSARTFVSWYNGHPYHSGALSPALDLSQLEHATIIGQGNVAIDVARILLKPVDALRAYDVPEPVLAALSRSRVKRVDIVGRRGALQLAATTKELRELLALPGVGFEADPALLAAAAADVEAHPAMDGARAKKRALGLLRAGSKTSLAAANRSWSLQFLRSPVELLPDSSTSSEATAGIAVRPQSLGAVRYVHNELVPSAADPTGDPSKFSARATAGDGSSVITPTDVLFKSVGYRALPLVGLAFDARRGCVQNDQQGRVVDAAGKRVDGLYTSGWLARGPTGVIATTMFDAFAAADTVAADLAAARGDDGDGGRPELPLERLRGAKRVVGWEDWEALDRVERERGTALGKLREKITDVGEMLALLP
ncbi:hypothetical protein JCM3770_007252 [Rhodotorula araucariae]